MVDMVSPADPSYCAEAAITAQAPRAGRLKRTLGRRHLEALPVGLFGSAAVLAVLSQAWRLAHNLYSTPIWIAQAFMVSALLAFAGLAIGYLMKLVAAPGAVRAEFCHPITGPLFGILPITLLVLPIVLARDLPSLATASWVLGTTSSLLLVWLTVGRWFAGERTDLHAAPTWIIPAIALLDIPVAMPLLAVPQMHGLESFGFGVGLFLAVVLFTLMAGRLVFGPPLPDALQPSVLVLVAPFATGFIAYVTMMHQVDLFSKSLYVIMAFLLAVLLPRLRRLGQCCPFEVSWWAVGFPLAMACLPALYFARTEPRLHNAVIALLLLSLATVTTAWLFCQTIIGLAKASLAAPRDPASAGMKATA